MALTDWMLTPARRAASASVPEQAIFWVARSTAQACAVAACAVAAVVSPAAVAATTIASLTGRVRFMSFLPLRCRPVFRATAWNMLDAGEPVRRRCPVHLIGARGPGG